MMPGWLVAAMIKGVNSGFFPRLGKASYIRALSARQPFMKDRMNRVHRVTVQTRLMEDILRKNGLTTPKVMFLPFGINTDGLSRKAPGNPQAKLRIGFIGTLYEHKGAHILLEAVRSLSTEIPIELKVYGNDNEFPRYTSRLRQIAANDPRIEFCGTFPNGRIGGIFSSLDVLAVPSIWYENTPLVIYSAQACGCPVIASNLGGTAEAVAHEENGLLFEAGNVSDLAQAISRLACDRTLLRKLGEQARKTKSIAEYAAELENVYKELVAERRTA
jgi:glycosyltransferase involved in cell wall biosynthesis